MVLPGGWNFRVAFNRTGSARCPPLFSTFDHTLSLRGVREKPEFFEKAFKRHSYTVTFHLIEEKMSIPRNTNTAADSTSLLPLSVPTVPPICVHINLKVIKISVPRHHSVGWYQGSRGNVDVVAAQRLRPLIQQSCNFR